MEKKGLSTIPKPLLQKVLPHWVRLHDLIQEHRFQNQIKVVIPKTPENMDTWANLSRLINPLSSFRYYVSVPGLTGPELQTVINAVADELDLCKDKDIMFLDDHVKQRMLVGPGYVCRPPGVSRSEADETPADDHSYNSMKGVRYINYTPIGKEFLPIDAEYQKRVQWVLGDLIQHARVLLGE